MNEQERLWLARGEYESLKEQHRKQCGELAALSAAAIKCLDGFAHYHSPHRVYTHKPDAVQAGDLIGRMRTLQAEADVAKERMKELAPIIGAE